jgi:hypothetical protein
MKSHEIFQALSPELRSSILTWAQTEAKQAFNTALFEVGGHRKLRPQYFLDKSKAERVKWLEPYLGWKAFDGVTEQVLQLWLLKGKTEMLKTFLDAAEIKHDGEGQVDDLPEKLDAKKVKAAVDAILKDNSPQEVAVYLHLFQRQREEGYPAVAAELEKREELKLTVPAK